MLQELYENYFNTEAGSIFYKISGKGPPLLLLHGYPQSHLMWHSVVPDLQEKYTVILPDLRGYGKSMTPKSDPEHKAYSKRVMANDMTKLMDYLGFQTFFLAGHDRGGRVAHRLTRDNPNRVRALSVIDICPTLDMYQATDMKFAQGYFHWFFLTQPVGVPEKLIEANPKLWVRNCLQTWSNGFNFREFEKYYISSFSNTKVIHSTCEDYRASATIDLTHDKEDNETLNSVPLQVIWGKKGLINSCFDPPKIWKNYFDKEIMACPIDCGHFIPEEAPNKVVELFLSFFK